MFTEERAAAKAKLREESSAAQQLRSPSPKIGPNTGEKAPSTEIAAPTSETQEGQDKEEGSAEKEAETE